MNDIKLNPKKPEEAIQIIDYLSKDLVLPRFQNKLFEQSLETLKNKINELSGK